MDNNNIHKKHALTIKQLLNGSPLCLECAGVGDPPWPQKPEVEALAPNQLRAIFGPSNKVVFANRMGEMETKEAFVGEDWENWEDCEDDGYYYGIIEYERFK